MSTLPILTHRLNLNLRHLPLHRPYVLLLAAWVLSMITLPILRWVVGDAAITWGVIATVILQSGAVFTALLTTWNERRILLVFILIAVITWLAEFIGSATGFPFGKYHYTGVLQPQLGDVPLIIPVAWFMMLPPSWAAAKMITGERRRWAFTGVSALALTAWDLFLDPQMVGWGFWVWDQPGVYFGIPLQNFAGWLLVAAVVTALARPDKLATGPLVLVYGIVWILQSIGQLFFWGLPGPAIFGFFGMGAVLLAAWRAHQRRERQPL